MDTSIRFVDGPYRERLSDAEFGRLIAVHPSGRARFSGARPRHDVNMDTLETGAVVLFTGQNRVGAIGAAGVSFRNAAFADLLWTPGHGEESWHNVYSVLDLHPTDIAYEKIWALPGFNKNDVFQQLRFLDEQKGGQILTGLGIEVGQRRRRGRPEAGHRVRPQVPLRNPAATGRSVSFRFVATRFWIAEIQISDEMEDKIRSRRFVTGDQVREACIPDVYERAGWHDDPVHGRRLLVEGRTADGVLLKVILQPIDVTEGIWRLRTVLRMM